MEAMLLHALGDQEHAHSIVGILKYNRLRGNVRAVSCSFFLLGIEYVGKDTQYAMEPRLSLRNRLSWFCAFHWMVHEKVVQHSRRIWASWISIGGISIAP